MDSTEIWWLIIPIILLPVFFAMGWFAARVDMKTVLKHAKKVPAGFYVSLDALVDKNTGKAVHNLTEVIDQQQGSYDLSLTLGKLYRQRGENDKAIAMHKALLDSPDTVGEKRERVLYELGLNYQSAGLVDRAEHIFLELQDGNMNKQARQVLLNIYEQDRDWEKAVNEAQQLAHNEQTYQFEIAQFYCEIAQTALFKSDFQAAREHIAAALDANKKCTRANMILGDIEQKQGNFQAAIDAYSAIEKQNHAYLSMIGERLYDAYDALGKPQDGLNVLIGYMKTFPELDLVQVIYDKSLLLNGEEKANQIAIDLIRAKPDLNGMYRLLGFQMSDLNPQWKADADMMRSVIGRQLQKAVMYRCRNCHFKSQVYFWHCPACNKWETFTPNKIEV
ncbi:lipopolysaccharide assembly protein LapB [Kingella negevensis]|uniref:Lipopolysaccharide assembly protein B n=1 Tax=Kingella negevensis TaxID=1522312 RepID=A0A238T902_9NEIS|nr:lipopolysaccharide assembly protein LapB [Kingella negevensis]MDK4679935.1 lipopolysaccharide assembly protein LapB [Kingella negevensis]MDK4682346.1 lipopolysaccharide assembly protein LapB [Kingella negevensis]MDK4684598.1 lipopolysaccharide assembly protein LapB [Kingella negevensis]MDK4690543.1 lipopolysaccharide assembly protein LapB [Kingella negevensis]MDK4692109.1 lipopolysaccharide assembly protein LapB [Kingella negevensis]